jgi:hypothetical protein
MDDLAIKIAFIESRLTLLERKLSQFLPAPDACKVQTGNVKFSCSEPGLLISGMYPTEQDEAGVEYCWIGNEGPIQLVLPIRASQALTCTLHLLPHPEVDFRRLQVTVNDDVQPATISYQSIRIMDVGFPVSPSAAPNLNIMLLGITSVRPSDFGENSDTRLLAARFFGATVTFI